MYTEGNTINSNSLSKAIKSRYIGCLFCFLWTYNTRLTMTGVG